MSAIDRQLLAIEHAIQHGKHVYVIPCGELVKVGVSGDPDRRWRNFRLANPLLEPILYRSEKLPYPTKVERAIHEQMDRFLWTEDPSREWFRCPGIIAVEIVEPLVNEHLKNWLKWVQS